MHPSVYLVLLNSIVLCFASKAEYRAHLKALANEVTDELNIIRHEAASDELARRYFPEVRNRFINHILFIYNAGDDAIRQKEKPFNEKQFKNHMLKLRKIRDDVLFGLKNEEITKELEIAGLEALLTETKATLNTVEGQYNQSIIRVPNRRQRKHRARGNRKRARRFRRPQFELPD